MKAKLINEKMPFEIVEFDFNPESLKYYARPGRPPMPGHRPRRRIDSVDPAEGPPKSLAGNGYMVGDDVHDRAASCIRGWIRVAVCSDSSSAPLSAR